MSNGDGKHMNWSEETISFLSLQSEKPIQEKTYYSRDVSVNLIAPLTKYHQQWHAEILFFFFFCMLLLFYVNIMI